MEDFLLRPPLDGGAGAFVAALRTMKTVTGLTYRQLEQKAAAEGRFVGRSTLANALTRDKLPSEAVVLAVVKGCGGCDEAAEEWLTARRRIAERWEGTRGGEGARDRWHGGECGDGCHGTVCYPRNPARGTGESVSGGRAGPAPPAPEERPMAGTGRRRLLDRLFSWWRGSRGSVVVPLSALAVIAAVLWADQSQEAGAGSREPAAAGPSLSPPLPRGTYLMSTASDHCLAEGAEAPERVIGVAYMTACRKGQTEVTLRVTPAGTYRFVLPSPGGGPDRCLGVADAGTAAADITVARCGGHRLGRAELFRMEEVLLGGDPEKPPFSEKGYRLRAEHLRVDIQDRGPDLCLGAPEADRKWARLRQMECGMENPFIFLFHPTGEEGAP
ncbi:XRE family transcriptional regulator [Streptomyces sp. NPDC000594]|uniref:XRE family transcriptional regulator n=1 Tax=Streptomyces sp. NPDC000594 TaxID=3154261 RepID=UPI00332C7E79